MKRAMRQVQKRTKKSLEIDPKLHTRIKAEAALAERLLYDFSNAVIAEGLKALKSKKAA